METLQPLAIESFSESWLSNHRPSFSGLDEQPRASTDGSHEGTYMELDYKKVKSNRFLTESQNFNFNIPIIPSSTALASADELFSNGLIRPVFVDPSKKQSCNTSDFISAIHNSSFSLRTLIPTRAVHHGFLRRWRKSTGQLLRNLFGCLRPFCHEAGCSRKSIRVDDIDRRVQQVRSWSPSPQASPQPSTVCSADDRCDLESLIYEAVLHCKRSIKDGRRIVGESGELLQMHHC
ncbi:hypothetical protein SLEP1_g10030 [Rubroshorea leprosula]|uniref:Membrane-associated kinase regulator 6 n=1 Tax=Rubroshorea leprosula TaxID=152421 RepID=A0AAV5IGN4_9ROSI|nr:hypothetical protein SLEP1_g10030 [Rubroshorea leprosula]